MNLKCAQCGELYDSRHMRCPFCQCGRITQRIFWSQADYDKDKAIKEGRA